MTGFGLKRTEFPPSREALQFAGGRVNARGQILSWGKFEVMGPITTTRGENPSQQLEKMDEQGDSFVDIIDGKFRCVYHTSGIVYIEKRDDGNPLTGWSDPLNGANLGTRVLPTLPRAGIVGTDNIDTPCIVPQRHKPAGTTGQLVYPAPLMVYYSCKPGVLPFRYPGEPHSGWVYCIQTATSDDPGNDPSRWTRDPDSWVLEPDNRPGGATWEREFSTPTFMWNGGVFEQSVLWDPDLGKYFLFYDGLSIGGHHLGRASSYDGIHWTKDQPQTPNSYVWSPADEPLGSFGSSKRTAPRFAVTRAPDGVYHLAMVSETPGVPNSVGIGHWYSTKQGEKGSWVPDPHNPLLTYESFFPFGFTAGGPSNKLGSPNFFFDAARDKVYLACSGGNMNEYRLGSRIWITQPKWSALWAP